MTARLVEVRAPARLHFGLFGFGTGQERQFGGVGAMIAEPCLRLRIRPADELRASGPQAGRALEFARRWGAPAQVRGGQDLILPRCAIEVIEAPPSHAGLGSGTQLALALARGLDAWHDRPRRDAVALAADVGRGLRSAVGLHGSTLGGLIVEAGKRADEQIAPLVERVALPARWAVVLLTPRGDQGLAGDEERRAFASLPAVSQATTATLWREVENELLPAIRQRQFERFAESVYRFGRASGECFAAVQGGPYRSPAIGALVERLRARGLRGIGQSSWGPTVFAWIELAAGQTATAAHEELLARGVLPPPGDIPSRVTLPDNIGTSVDVDPATAQ